jgi:AcrR family transcriptional regulator
MPSGRPRAFDPEKALDCALKVFWRKGYEGASLSDLTKAMGINRPSLYATYGDKAALFCKAMDRYVELHACHVRAALNAPAVRQVIELLWRGGIALVRSSKNPRGCFLVQGALACGEAAQGIQRAMARERSLGETALRERFERAISDGDLPQSVNAASLAHYVSAISYGIAVQAAGGATVAELESVVEFALQALPRQI